MYLSKIWAVIFFRTFNQNGSLTAISTLAIYHYYQDPQILKLQRLAIRHCQLLMYVLWLNLFCQLTDNSAPVDFGFSSLVSVVLQREVAVAVDISHNSNNNNKNQ